MKIQDKIIINAPVDRVFAVFSNLTMIEARVPAISKIEILEGSARLEIGTKWRETRRMFGKEATEVMWVTELEENRRYVIEAGSSGMQYLTEYIFAELPHETTEVALTFTAKPMSFSAKVLNLASAVFSRATKKTLHQDLESLKQSLEPRS